MQDRDRQEPGEQQRGIWQGLYFRGKIPVITLVCCIVSVFLFLLANISDQTRAIVEQIVPSAPESLDGQYWGLISSNFLHIAFWHIFFNLSWIWPLGKQIEHNEEKVFYFWLVVSSALASSLAQMSVSDSFGIGLSGVVYAFFGFILLRQRSNPGYEGVLDKRTTHFFFIWLVACVVLTHLDILPVANAAHAGGLIWGIVLGVSMRFKAALRWTIGILAMAGFAAWLLWSPFTTVWLMRDAFRLHDSQQLDAALVVYRKIIDRDPKNETALANIRQLEVYQLASQLPGLYNSRKLKETKELADRILSIEPENEQARAYRKLLATDTIP